MAKVMNELTGSRVELSRDEDELINRTKMTVNELREHLKRLGTLGYTVGMSISGQDDAFISGVTEFKVMLEKTVTKNHEL